MSRDQSQQQLEFAAKLLRGFGDFLPKNSTAELTKAPLSYTQNLLSPSSSPAEEATPARLSNVSVTVQPESENLSSRWGRCLERLAGDFLRRKTEMLQLNPGRRTQIESHISELEALGQVSPLDKLIGGRSASKGLEIFAWEMAVFHLLQLLLLRKWLVRGELETSSLPENSQKVNWLIASYLRKASKQNILSPQQWGFLRTNIYSWFKPAPDVWAFVLEASAVEQKDTADIEFLARVLLGAREHGKLEEIGFHSCPLFAKLSWEILLRQYAIDDGSNPTQKRSLGPGPAGRVFLAGLGNGMSITAARSVGAEISSKSMYGFARSSFELFLAEIFFLWSRSGSEEPLFQGSTIDRLFESRPSQGGLAQQELSIPAEAGHALVVPNLRQPDSTDPLIETARILSKIRDHGTVLLASNNFWISDRSDESETLRTQCLEQAALRVIIDFRHLSVGAGVQLPQGFFLLEKMLSKELRDANRPRIIKARGHLTDLGTLEDLWQLILDCLAIKDAPGEVKIFHAGDGAGRVRVEVMSAATHQAQLGSSPWQTIADPGFYQVSAKLKQFPQRLHQHGFLLKPQHSPGMSSQKGIHFVEVPGVALYADPQGQQLDSKRHPLWLRHPKAVQHLFVPELGVNESSGYFSALINSSAIQFWYRLEWENNFNSVGRRSNRSAESILKLMPLARIFRGLSAAVAPTNPAVITNLQLFREELHSLFNDQFSLANITDPARLQRWICNLEATIDYHLTIAREYAKHLFQDLEITRWNIPSALPEMCPDLGLSTLQHLQHAPVLQHPALQVQYLKHTTDFKVTQTKLHLGQAGLSELLVFCGPEPHVKISGPTLLIRATAMRVNRRLQRSWLEISQKISFPIDTGLLLKQIAEFVRLTEAELETTHEAVALQDFIFARIFELQAAAPACGDAQLMRNHLSPSLVTRRLMGGREDLVEFKPLKPQALDLNR